MWSRPAVFGATVFGELAVGPEVAMVLRTLAEGGEREREWKKREMKGRKERVRRESTHNYKGFLWVYCSCIICLAEPLVDHALHVVKAHCGC